MTPTLYFAEAVKRYRTDWKWSQPELARRCQRAGLDWDRSIVANVESGRRVSVSIHEVLTLAHVLGVPPVQLILPLGEEETIEVVAGVTVHPVRALGWLNGHDALPGSPVPREDFARRSRPVALLAEATDLHDEAHVAKGLLRNAERFHAPGSRELVEAAHGYRTALGRMVAWCEDLNAAGVKWSGMLAEFYDDAKDLGLMIPEYVPRYEETDDGR